MDLWLERSALPERLVAPELALDFHIDAAARWLRVAGAEPRLALFYVSGPAARQALVAGLEARRCRVESVTARIGQPVPPALAQHKGDHFNDVLYLVDGLSENPTEVDATRLLREIGLEIAQYRRLATWVGVVIEGPVALAALEVAGGILRRHAHRRFALLSPDDAPPAPGAAALPGELATAWRKDHRVAELVFAQQAGPEFEPDYLDVARLARAGYGALPVRGPLSADAVALRTLLQTPPTDGPALAPWVDRPPVSVAEFLVRHVPAAQAERTVQLSLAMTLAGEPGVRYAGRFPVRDAPAFAALSAVRDLVDAGQTVTDSLIAALVEAGHRAPPALRVHLALARASAAVASEAIEPAVAALAEAAAIVDAEGIALPPELAFEVIEKQTGLQAFTGERAHARAGLDRLGELLPRLHSPFYTARHALARGEQMLGLDPGRAREILREAGMLFDAHGYTGWARAARAALD